MEKNEYTMTRIVLKIILDDLKEAVLDQKKEEVDKKIEELKEEFKYYLTLD